MRRRICSWWLLCLIPAIHRCRLGAMSQKTDPIPYFPSLLMSFYREKHHHIKGGSDDWGEVLQRYVKVRNKVELMGENIFAQQHEGKRSSCGAWRIR